MRNIFNTKYFNLKKVFLILILSIFTLGCSFAKSYQPDFDVQSYISQQTEVTIVAKKNFYQVSPANSNPDTALIFYPGGKVSYEAYLPLLVEFSKKGIMCLMPHMPKDLAIFGISSADKLINSNDYKEIKHWYIGGHSLGGAMAASYCNKNSAKLEGLVLLAAYSTANLSETNLKVVSVYGSKDGVLKMDNYNKYKPNLPAGFKEFILDGGNHGNFGCYGFQEGDNPATLSSEQQKKITADFVF